jgi:hypothetical protein
MLSLWSSGTDVRATEFVEERHSCRRAPSVQLVWGEDCGWSRSAGITRIPFWEQLASLRGATPRRSVETLFT